MGVKFKNEEKEKKWKSGRGGRGGRGRFFRPLADIFFNRTLIPIHSEKYVFSLGSAIQPEDFNATTGVPKKKKK